MTLLKIVIEDREDTLFVDTELCRKTTQEELALFFAYAAYHLAKNDWSKALALAYEIVTSCTLCQDSNVEPLGEVKKNEHQD